MTDRGKAYAIRDVHISSVAVMLAQLAERDAKLARIARILDDFRRAPLSISSVQPILALAEELNGAMR
jgi:hypothetical protein